MIYTHIHTHTYTYIYTDTHTHTHTHTYIYIYNYNTIDNYNRTTYVEQRALAYIYKHPQQQKIIRGKNPIHVQNPP